MNKHTKGKWEIKEVGFPKDREFWITNNQNIVARVTRVLCKEGEAEANARLIAAAPELLAELVKAHNVINRLVEEIHKNHTKTNNIVELIKWPTIGEVERKNVIGLALGKEIESGSMLE